MFHSTASHIRRGVVCVCLCDVTSDVTASCMGWTVILKYLLYTHNFKLSLCEVTIIKKKHCMLLSSQHIAFMCRTLKRACLFVSLYLVLSSDEQFEWNSATNCLESYKKSSKRVLLNIFNQGIVVQIHIYLVKHRAQLSEHPNYVEHLYCCIFFGLFMPAPKKAQVLAKRKNEMTTLEIIF